MHENKFWNEYEEGYPRYYCKSYSESGDSHDDSRKYIPRVAGTRLEFGIAFLCLKYFPILTSRVSGEKRRFYLFDRFQVMEKREDV